MTHIVNLRQYCTVAGRQAWIIALVVALAVGGALYGLATQPPQYQAEASILVPPEGIAPAARADTGVSALRYAYRDTVLNDIVHLLRSRTVSERAAEQVGGLSGEELARRVMVRNIPGTDFLIIRTVDAQPERAALIANAMAKELGGFYAQMYQADATRARLFIEDQLRRAQDQRAAAEQAVLEFQARTGARSLPDEVSQTARRILDLQAAYDTATLDEATARTQVAAIQSHLAAQSDPQLASLSITTNPVVAQIRDHLTGLELQLADLRQVYTDQHPAVKALQGKIAADDERLRVEAAKVLAGTSLAMSPAREQFVREMIDGEVNVATAGARAAGIRAILGRLQARLDSVPSDALALARLQRDAQDSEDLVTRLSALQQESVMRESQAVASGQSAIVVVDQALAPGRPITPPFSQTAALAGLLGLCFGAALAFAAEEMGKRIRASCRPEAPSAAPEGATVPPMAARSRFRSLAAALGVAVVMLMAGVGAGVFESASGAQVGAVLAHVSHAGQALMRTFLAVQ